MLKKRPYFTKYYQKLNFLIPGVDIKQIILYKIKSSHHTRDYYLFCYFLYIQFEERSMRTSNSDMMMYYNSEGIVYIIISYEKKNT